MAWLLYTRRGCHLCDEAEDLVHLHVPGAAIIDVDADDAARSRYDLRVPVLECDGIVVMEGRFDEAGLVCEIMRHGGTAPPSRP